MPGRELLISIGVQGGGGGENINKREKRFIFMSHHHHRHHHHRLLLIFITASILPIIVKFPIACSHTHSVLTFRIAAPLVVHFVVASLSLALFSS
jgi:hypothetical protein